MKLALQKLLVFSKERNLTIIDFGGKILKSTLLILCDR